MALLTTSAWAFPYTEHWGIVPASVLLLCLSCSSPALTGFFTHSILLLSLIQSSPFCPHCPTPVLSRIRSSALPMHRPSPVLSLIQSSTLFICTFGLTLTLSPHYPVPVSTVLAPAWRIPLGTSVFSAPPTFSWHFHIYQSCVLHRQVGRQTQRDWQNGVVVEVWEASFISPVMLMVHGAIEVASKFWYKNQKDFYTEICNH